MVYVLGGMGKHYRPVDTVTVINIESRIVSEGPPMLTPRMSPAVTTWSGEIFVCGGCANEDITSCERLRPGARCGTTNSDSIPRSNHL